MGEVLYDTSSLIEEAKSGVKELKAFTTILNIIEFPKALDMRGLRIIYPTYDDYKLAVKLSMNLLKRGEPVPAIDILIAAIAVNNKMTLKTRDRHFESIRRVESRLKME